MAYGPISELFYHLQQIFQAAYTFKNGQSYTFTLFLFKIKQNLINKTYNNFHLPSPPPPLPGIAQSLEHQTLNQGVVPGAEGSSPTECGKRLTR